MAQSQLDIDTIGDLQHGQARFLGNDAINKAVKDTEDRGLEDGKERVVVITLTFVKKNDDDISIGFSTKVTVPKYQINDTMAQIKMDPTVKGPVLNFRSENPGNPRQPTMFEKPDGEVPNED